MCIKQLIIFGYLSACNVQIISDNDPQVVIYMPVIMPFHKLYHAYTANSTCRGYMDAESLYGIM